MSQTYEDYSPQDSFLLIIYLYKKKQLWIIIRFNQDCSSEKYTMIDSLNPSETTLKLNAR